VKSESCGAWCVWRVGVSACRVAVDGVDAVDLVDGVEWGVAGSISEEDRCLWFVVVWLPVVLGTRCE
jgi:hypothetical protein